MKKFVAFAASAACIALASPALAANLEPQVVLPFTTYTPNVGGTFGNQSPVLTPFNPGKINFNNLFNFFTTFERLATVDITSTMTAGQPQTNVNFISNGVKLDAQIIPAVSTGTFEERYLANFRIPAGAQQILVQGSAGNNSKYAGLLTLSGVPEPSTWAMMILGLGFAGAAMRRRRQTTRVTYA